MNKTIEERAEEYGKQFIGMCSSYEAYAEREDVEKAYIQGANDQRKIYIDKACEWLEDNADKFYMSSSQADDCYFDTDKMIEDFRKAMEEKL